MNKLTRSVVVTFENATPKNFNNALAPTINLCHRCLLFKNSCENISKLQMLITHTRIVQTKQFLYLLTSAFSVDIIKNTKIVLFRHFLSDLWAFESC